VTVTTIDINASLPQYEMLAGGSITSLWAYLPNVRLSPGTDQNADIV
jgi:hypothetical protein